MNKPTQEQKTQVLTHVVNGAKFYHEKSGKVWTPEPSNFPNGWGLPEGSKLILHPLSDLTKPLNQDGKDFIPADILLNDRWYPVDRDYLKLNIIHFTKQLRFEDVLYLISWRFDVFRLIESELAIDVNTLDVNPYE